MYISSAWGFHLEGKEKINTISYLRLFCGTLGSKSTLLPKLEQQAETQWYTCVDKVLPLILRKLCFLSDSAKLLCWYYSSPTVSLKWHTVILTSLVKFLNSRDEKDCTGMKAVSIIKGIFQIRKCPIHYLQNPFTMLWGIKMRWVKQSFFGKFKAWTHEIRNAYHKLDSSLKNVSHIQLFYKIELQ